MQTCTGPRPRGAGAESRAESSARLGRRTKGRAFRRSSLSAPGLRGRGRERRATLGFRRGVWRLGRCGAHSDSDTGPPHPQRIAPVSFHGPARRLVFGAMRGVGPGALGLADGGKGRCLERRIPALRCAANSHSAGRGPRRPRPALGAGSRRPSPAPWRLGGPAPRSPKGRRSDGSVLIVFRRNGKNGARRRSGRGPRGLAAGPPCRTGLSAAGAGFPSGRVWRCRSGPAGPAGGGWLRTGRSHESPSPLGAAGREPGTAPKFRRNLPSQPGPDSLLVAPVRLNERSSTVLGYRATPTGTDSHE